jgi:peroxiredoxin
MKKIIYLFICAALMAACKPKEVHYVVDGNITGADSVTFLLQKRVSGRMVTIDSALVKVGTFTMKGGAVEFPEMVTLMAKGLRKGISFYLENSDITITGNLDSLYVAKVTGSKTQDEYNSLLDMIKPLQEEYSNLYEEYREAEKTGDEEKTAALESKFDSIQNEMSEVEKNFIRNNPSSYVAPTILRSLSYEMEPDEIESFISAMDTNVAKMQIVKDLQARVMVMKTVAVGQKAPDFTLNDVNDQPLSLSSKIGKSKLLLIDFWASWCGPCRQENPNLVKVWKEFNKKGFDVFSVSLDRPGEKDKWLQAIKDDKLTWTHVSDLKYWDCAAAKLYAVNAIPANFLLDETGTIIARNLRGDALYSKVKELLGSK